MAPLASQFQRLTVDEFAHDQPHVPDPAGERVRLVVHPQADLPRAEVRLEQPAADGPAGVVVVVPRHRDGRRQRVIPDP